MANVHLTQRDVDYIARVVDTEVPRSIAKRNPAEYNRMVRAVVDTVTNRMASGQFPSTATGVLNQRRQFSKITGPSSLDPYGSVQQTPRAPAAVKSLVMDHVAARAAGAPPSIGGALNYANPHFSSKSNLGWIGDMINAGAEKLGVGKSVHYHGNAPGTRPVGEYALSAESMPGSFVPRPTPRGGIFQAEGLGGILSAIDPATPARVERQDLPSVPSPSMTPSTAQSGVVPSEATAYADLGRNVAVGGVNPFAETAAPKMSLAEQYAAYGQGQAIARNMGLLSQDVAEFSPQLHPVQQMPQGDMTDLPPATEVAGPASPTAYVEPAPAPEAPAANPASAAAGGGLLSPREQEMVRQQQLSVAAMGPNRRAQIGSVAKKGLGAFGGGVLGGLLLGPLGAIAGGLIGPTLVNGVTQSPNYPKRPESTPKGDGKMTDYGRSVARESGQFRDAVKSGRGGLW
ncbi:hypothetical protein GOL85_13250 [Sinorhizobium medicae]|nr:hypothetical protein [Sinorhizobium medicae]